MIINWDCSLCSERKKCKKLCPPMEFAANNKSETREVLFSSLTKRGIETTEFKNYNQVISELAEDKERDFESIVFIADYRKRAIAAMLYADIPKEAISDLLQLSRRHIYRLIK